MKPYQKIPIQDCEEPLVPIPLELFSVLSPHPYAKLGADYRGKSPYYLRLGVLEALLKAQTALDKQYPGWRILIFDAYRPVAVQQFMVDYTFSSVLNKQKLTVENLSPEEEKIWSQVYELWAMPSYDLTTPPPHSTGAAIDLTLIDATGNLVDMGGDIDELSERSHPNYYAQATRKLEQMYCQNREILYRVMKEADFQRHQGEWWHFSLGDQMWVWLEMLEHPEKSLIARYGRVTDDARTF